MHNQSIDKNAALIEPLFDTWDIKKDAGYWSINLPCNLTLLFSVQERNIWYVNTMKTTLNVFSELARVFSVSFGPIPSANTKVKGMSLEWQPEDTYEQYLEQVFQAIRNYPVDIYLLIIEVDLCVFVRTQTSSDRPIRGWVRHRDIGNFEISLQFEDRQPYIYFSIQHSLFCPDDYRCPEDNDELFSLNQPLLENALRQWEEQLAPISDFEGRGTIYKYGFLSEEEWNAQRESN
jgi:hypothetical protein